MTILCGSPKPIEYWAYVITGFRQNRSTQTRLIELWRRLHQTFGGDDRNVALRPWNCDWDAEAEFIHRWSPADHPPRILVVAYSWGGGWAFPRLARKLQERGLVVDKAILCDPVYRHGYRCGNWRALVPWSRIRIPGNVKTVETFIQERSCLRGHQPRAMGSHTIMAPLVRLVATHSTMDDHPEFIHRCLAVARRLFKEPPRPGSTNPREADPAGNDCCGHATPGGCSLTRECERDDDAGT